MKFGRNIGGLGHHGLVIGPLEILVWRDTGTPRFRPSFWRYEQKSYYSVCTYHWIFKLMSWWTLWIAWRGPAHSGK